MSEPAGTFVYRFDRCELQPRERRLLIAGAPAALPARAFDVLLALVERAGQLVTKDELCARVWSRLAVEENNLQQQVSTLRRVLGADAIATVPGHGYRFTREPLRITPAAPATAHTAAGRLPQPLTSFVGRERELAEARALLASARLLTLVGMGGIGKTRLSLQLAEAAASACPDGAWFVDLASLRDGSLVPHQVAQVLGVQEEAGLPLQHTLGTFVRARRMLIVLDNCEHLVADCARLVDALLRAAPSLRIVATSREALRLPGEQLYTLLPMDLPAAGDVERAAGCDAVRLLVDRVRLHRPAFVPDPGEVAQLAELCARLDGIPLALELAAARLQTLSIADINLRLRDRFALLSGGARLLAERQQTLRAMLDWSYELLSPQERLLCDRLSVFAGGWDLAAAEEVCGSAPLDRGGMLELLSRLVDKSIVLVDQRGGQARMRMLETMRDYAHERLAARGEVEPTAARHCQHFFAVAKAANRDSAGPGSAWAERIETELDNLRAAIAHALGPGGDPVLAVKLEVALLKFRLLRGPVGEGRRNLQAALDRPELRSADLAHAHALYASAGLAASQGEHAQAALLLEACLALRRGIGNRTDIAATLSTLALVRLQAGDATGAGADENQALELFRELDDRVGQAVSLLHLGQIEMHLEHDAQARSHLQGGLGIARGIGHAEIASECERMLGDLALHAGDLAAARACLASSLDACRKAGDRRGEAQSAWGLARVDLAAGDGTAARPGLEAALRVFRSLGLTLDLLGCVEDFAVLAQATGDHARAAGLFATAGAARERLKLAPAPRARRALDQALGHTRQTLGDDAFRAATQQGREAGLEDAVRRLLGAPA